MNEQDKVSNNTQTSVFTETETTEQEFQYTVTEHVSYEQEVVSVPGRDGSTSMQTFRLKGEEQTYIVEESDLSRGQQARIFSCVGSSDNQEYIMKLYYRNMIRTEGLAGVLEKLKGGNSPYVSKIIEYGLCDYRGEETYYVIMPKYQPLQRMNYTFQNNQDSKQYEKRLLALISQLNKALKYLHLNDIYHGDIKPDNIMWNPATKNIVLIDFGGSVEADRIDKSVEGAATTRGYLPPETMGNNKLNTHVDYYSLGVALAELIDGVYPKQEDWVRNTGVDVASVGYCFIPQNLPSPYRNLLRGLLYEHPEENPRKRNRWTASQVDYWLGRMYDHQYDEAARCNPANDGRGVESENVSVGRQRAAGSKGVVLRFKDEIYLDLGGEWLGYSTLNEVADAFAANWDEGISLLLDEDVFDRDKVGNDVMRAINSVVDKMKNVNEVNGESMEAEYFKFLYGFLSDKSEFHWKQLPKVTDKRTFALRFMATLTVARNHNNSFGQWWKCMNDETKSTATVFAEIFANRVLSTYLKANREADKELLAQCDKVEKIFAERKEKYSFSELAEMYLLAEMLAKGAESGVGSGSFYSYRSYREIAQKLADYVKEPVDMDGFYELWNFMADGEYYNPHFYAWMQIYEPGKLTDIRHGLKLER